MDARLISQPLSPRSQYHHIPASGTGHQVFTRFHPDATVHIRDGGPRLRAKGRSRAARPGRSVGQSVAGPRHFRVLLAQRHRTGAGGLARSVSGERGAEGTYRGCGVMKTIDTRQHRKLFTFMASGHISCRKHNFASCLFHGPPPRRENNNANCR